MTRERAKLSLDAPTSIDVSQFKPKAPRRADGATSGAGDAVAAAHGFTPREPVSTIQENAPINRKRNRPPPYDAHMSIRAYQSDVDAFHALAGKMGWKSGKLLSELLKAYEAQRE
jgi:hypothetical protein